MEFLKHFFRANTDGIPLKPYSPVHIAILLVVGISIYCIYKKKFNLSNKQTNKKFLLTIASILVIDQIILYSWQFSSGYFKIQMSLPLYHCRIAVWTFIIAIFTNNRLMKAISLFWGSIGAVLALTIPDLYKFSFPHYTNFNFFIMHISFALLVVDFLFVEKFKLNINDLKKVIIFTNIYNIGLILFNLVLLSSYPDINYGYIMALPGGESLFGSKFINTIITITLFNFITIVLYKIFTYKSEERKIWELSRDLIKN